MKQFYFHNSKIIIIPNGYGNYILKGLNNSVSTSDSTIYDWCDDESNKTKYMSAKRTAYQLLKKN